MGVMNAIHFRYMRQLQFDDQRVLNEQAKSVFTNEPKVLASNFIFVLLYSFVPFVPFVVPVFAFTWCLSWFLTFR